MIFGRFFRSAFNQLQAVGILSILASTTVAILFYASALRDEKSRQDLAMLAEGTHDAGRLVTVLYGTLVEFNGVLTAGDDVEARNAAAGLEARAFEVGEAVDRLRARVALVAPGEFEAVAKACSAWQAYIKTSLSHISAGKISDLAASLKSESVGQMRQALHVAAEELALKLNEESDSAGKAAEASGRRDANLAGFLVALIVMFGLGAYVHLRAMIVKPLREVIRAMSELARGNVTQTAVGTGRSDEIGELSNALVVFRANWLERDRLARIRAEEEALLAARQTQIMTQIDAFDGLAQSGTGAVAAASRTLHDTALGLSDVATQTGLRMSGAAQTTAQVSARVSQLSQAGDNMSQAMERVARETEAANEVAEKAAAAAARTSVKINELSEAARTIGGTVDLISAIAGKTNLLALNATIEAARAGDAGRGFAIVAAEVKQLALQTANATSEIVANIERVQGVTAETIATIEDIEKRIGELADIATSVSAAVQQQRQNTAVIADGMQVVAEGAASVAETIAGLNSDTAATGKVSSDLLASAALMTEQAERMSTQIAAFLAGLKAA